LETPQTWADETIGRAASAAEAFLEFDQERTDRIVRAVFEATYAARLDLARLAHEETAMGLYEHKAIKTRGPASSSTRTSRPPHGRRDRRGSRKRSRGDCGSGVDSRHDSGHEPPSTTIFKSLICMKTRNPVIFSPHRGARKCIREAARICAEAATAAGAPAGAIQWVTKPQPEYFDALMRHRRLALILATGTGSIVRTAQASGTPTLGVGPGNVPVYVHGSADLAAAARDIVHSKTFDNGVVCASEQALVVERGLYAKLRELMEARGTHFCSMEESRLLGPHCFDPQRRGMRADVVGQPAASIAERAGFRVDSRVRLLVAEPEGVGPDDPLSYEILAPVLACYVVESYDAALATCRAVVAHGGLGHTVGVHANDERVVADFSRLDVGRVLVNQPATEGAIGGIFSALRPSLTLACGAGGGNMNTDNITVDHLMDIRRVARFHDNNGGTACRETWLMQRWTARDSGIAPRSPDAAQARATCPWSARLVFGAHTRSTHATHEADHRAFAAAHQGTSAPGNGVGK
jgi:acetaldehyde dehydrogenase/alcohol dehydrogenase